MITKKRPRHYCEYCGKGSGNPAYMKRHERGCTLNPNRVCGFCELRVEHLGGEPQKPIKTLIEALGEGSAKDLKKLEKIAEGCPACMLAALRQSGLSLIIDYDEEGICRPVKAAQLFNYRERVKEFWDKLNDAKWRAENERN